MSDFAPCPNCPDGSVWTPCGPTGRKCPTCGGFAVTHLDGSKVTRQEFDAECEPESEDQP